MAREQYAPDRYDLVTHSGRAGVHRAPVRSGTTWLRLLVVALLTAVLATFGILLLVIGPANVQLPTAIDEKNPVVATKVTASFDPATTVSVLNGTSQDGLESAVDRAIEAEGWGTVSFASLAEDRDVAITAVFYVDPKDEGLAKGLGEKLGGASFYQQGDYASYGTQLVVLLGSDYVGPGSQ